MCGYICVYFRVRDYSYNNIMEVSGIVGVCFTQFGGILDLNRLLLCTSLGSVFLS